LLLDIAPGHCLGTLLLDIAWDNNREGNIDRGVDNTLTIYWRREKGTIRARGS